MIQYTCKEYILQPIIFQFMKTSNYPQTKSVSTFQSLINTTFEGDTNAVCWQRKLVGDFNELVNKLTAKENITVITEEELTTLQLSEQGDTACKIILNDIELLKAHGASPTLNLIKYYERDSENSFFPTDVYSFHADSSPITTDTFLCTYSGESSEILPNKFAEKKVLIPEIRNKIKMNFHGTEIEFENFLHEQFYDLHYEVKSETEIIKCGNGNLWRLAVDSPESHVLSIIQYHLK